MGPERRAQAGRRLIQATTPAALEDIPGSLTTRLFIPR
jgi:hypothetical protein